MPSTQAIEQLIVCCHCKSWAERVVGMRPFASEEAFFSAADTVWRNDFAAEEHLFEAMKGHRRIGDIQGLREKYAAEMLELLRARLPHTRAQEIDIAHQEQAKIT